MGLQRWYREAVNEVARDSRSVVSDFETIALEAFCLTRNRGHTLFAFNDLGWDKAVWLPDFSPRGLECFQWDAPSMFDHGFLTLSLWLADQRKRLFAKRLLLLREPVEPKIRRPKVFKPKKKPPPPTDNNGQFSLL